MDVAQHFLSVSAKSLTRLTALMEEAAAVLDQRGSRPLRMRIAKELHFALTAVRAVDTSLNNPMCEEPRRPFLLEVVYRAQALKEVRAPRSGSARRVHRAHNSTGLRLVVDNTGGDHAA